MRTGITVITPDAIDLPGGLPVLLTTAGERAAWRFVDFCTATIRNPNTREAYLLAVRRFLAWCERRGVRALTAIRQCFDWLLSGGVLDSNQPNVHLRAHVSVRCTPG